MRVSVKNLTIGVTSYLGVIAGGYWWALSQREDAAKEELSKLAEDAQGRPKAFSEEERLSVFGKGAGSYDKEIGTDETVMGLNLLRWWLLGKARGAVLEVAGGTGRNIDYISPARGDVTSLTIVDLCQAMVAQLEHKLKARRRADVTFGVMDVQKLTFPNRSFDTVVDTFGLCSFEDPTAALREMERVTKDDGQILLLEHGRSHYDWLNAILNKNSHRHTARWGCIWNRDVEGLVRDAGLEIKSIQRWHFGTTYVIQAAPRQRAGDALAENGKGWWLGRWLGRWVGGSGARASTSAPASSAPAPTTVQAPAAALSIQTGGSW